MKKTSSRVNKAMRETVDIDGLADKIFGKYLKFVQTKVAQPGPHIRSVQAPTIPVVTRPIEDEQIKEYEQQIKAMQDDLGSVYDDP